MGVFSPSDVKPRLCCFCVPSRIGTLFLSTLSLLISVTIALQATVALFRQFLTLAQLLVIKRPRKLSVVWFGLIEDNWVNGFLVWVCLAQCVLWWSLVTVCVYGWLGTVKQRYEWVEWYYDSPVFARYQWHLWINVVLGSYGIIIFSLPAAKQYRAEVCTALAVINKVSELGADQVLSSTDSAYLAAECVSLVKKHLLLIDFAYLIGILIQLYLVLMVAHFLDELADRQAAEKWGVDIESERPPYDVEEIRGGGGVVDSRSRGKI
ncbi:uncharacterized protein JCM6883_000562 [Sporobolomyces salmoneus]|uniref:uncharacterized protein n=1 Tax=Sporobolomyces salmoneus TaxID=183962 RepID=UPI00317A822E